MYCKKEEGTLAQHEKQEMWHYLVESKGNISQLAANFERSQEFVERELLTIFIESLLIVNHHLGKRENEEIIRKVSLENMLSIIQQASRNSYYTSVKNLSVLLSMIQCTLYSYDLERNLKDCQQQIRFESVFFEIKSMFGNEDLRENVRTITVMNDSSTVGTFRDIYIKLDIPEAQVNLNNVPRRQQISDRQFLTLLNRLMIERKIPYWEQTILRWSLMHSVFGN